MRDGQDLWKGGRAFACGAVAGALTSLGMWAARDGLGVPIHLETILGTATGLSPGRGTFAVGLVMYLVGCGLVAQLYAIGFEHVAHRSGALPGAIVSVAHLVIAGLAIGAIAPFHRLVPELIAAPGPFASFLGDGAVAAFVIAHALFGVVVGALYGPVLHPERPPLEAPQLGRRTA